MPSACTKPDNKASPEVESPIKQVITLVDKKVRNLEKRRGKLDGYREKVAKGSELNHDQQQAVNNYESVLQTLVFAKELQKQFLAIQSENEKLMKKQLKREAHERTQQEIRRIKEVLSLQNLLDSLGAEETRADFAAGEKGAVKLTEEELNKLDELYKLISPTRDEENDYNEQLMKASEHIVNFLDGKDRAVLGTTYKDLRSLIEKITECGYFEKSSKEEPVEEAEEDSETAELVAEAASGDSDVQQVTESQLEQSDQTTDDNTQQSQLDFGLGTESTVTMLGQHTSAVDSMPVGDNCIGSAVNEEEETFFSTQPTSSEPRPFNEIVSSVQGNFNFLQDSEIDQQVGIQSAQQLDPAVVAAQMASQNVDPMAFNEQFQQQQQQSTQSQDDSLQQQYNNLQTNTAAPSALDTAAFDEQTMYAQSLMTQGLQSTAAQYNESSTQQSFDQNNYGLTQHSSSELADPPQPIPLPGQYDEGSNADADKNKKFSMNPDADIFQSMYSGGNPPSTTVSSDSYQQQDSKASYQNAWSNNDFQQGYGSGQYGNRRSGDGRNNTGAYRGAQGGGSGGRNSGQSMSNGYRGNQRGGSAGGQRGGGRGGMYNGGGRSGGGMQQQQQRGGGNKYQGYPPRSDYQPEGGYQGYNAGGYMPVSQGGPRGGPRGGGPPRGGRGNYGNRMAAQ